MIHIGSLLHPVRKQQAFFLLGFSMPSPGSETGTGRDKGDKS